MLNNILARIFDNEFAVFILIVALMLAFAEVGFRLGLPLHRKNDAARKVQIGGIQGAVLGLLGLLLGFTFAMAVARFDTRRGLIVKEASSITTTYLRASLLPESHQEPVRDLLRRYVEVRLKYWPLVDDPTQRAEGRRLIGDLQTELWKHATAAAKEAPTEITGMFISSANETIDADTERIAAMRASIPQGVWILLIIVAASGCFTTTYRSGAEGVRSKLGTVFLPVVISVVIVLIFDISHARIGLIQIQQDPLIDLLQSMQSK